MDGTYRGGGSASRGAFHDINRIDLLRGTQPVYFDNSKINSAFKIDSCDPSDEL